MPANRPDRRGKNRPDDNEYILRAMETPRNYALFVGQYRKP